MRPVHRPIIPVPIGAAPQVVEETIDRCALRETAALRFDPGARQPRRHEFVRVTPPEQIAAVVTPRGIEELPPRRLAHAALRRFEQHHAWKFAADRPRIIVRPLIADEDDVAKAGEAAERVAKHPRFVADRHQAHDSHA